MPRYALLRFGLFGLTALTTACEADVLDLEPGAPRAEPVPATIARAPSLPTPSLELPEAPEDLADATVVAIGLGRRHTCAVTKLGALHCWGAGERGQTGLGRPVTIGDDETPRANSRVQLGDRIVVDVAAGHHHTCAITAAGEVVCFGVGAYGQLGLGDTEDVGDDEHPTAAVDLGARATRVTAGEMHTCVLLETGAVRCFGAGADGRLGSGATANLGDDEGFAASEVRLDMDVVDIAAGDLHTCALSADGRVKCWGENDDGRLGYGFTEDVGDDETDIPALELPGRAVAISAGTSHTCVVLEDGAVSCFGRDRYGELGLGSSETVGDDETAEGALVDLGAPAVAVSAGNFRTCVTLETGAVRCWGYPFDGGLGVADTAYAPSPRAARDVGLGMPARAVVSGADHSCAIVEGFHLRCWGRGDDGRLGYGNVESVGDDELPADVGDVAL